MEWNDYGALSSWHKRGVIGSILGPGMRRRLNWANDRKEFFKIELSEVQAALVKFGLRVELLTVPEAREYRETISSLAVAKEPSLGFPSATNTKGFPEDPFEASGSSVAPH